MTKFYKHEAESIKESNDKQFVSQAEKDKWNSYEDNNSNLDEAIINEKLKDYAFKDLQYLVPGTENERMLLLKRSTEENLKNHIGYLGEVIVDVDNKTLVVQDGETSGGYSLVKKEDLENYATKEYVDVASTPNTDFGYIGGELGNNPHFPDPTYYIQKHFSEDRMRYYAIYDYRNSKGQTTIKLIISDNTFYYGPFSAYKDRKYFTGYSSSSTAGDSQGYATHVIYDLVNGEWQKTFGPGRQVVDVDELKDLSKEKEQTTRFYACNFELKWNELNKDKVVVIDSMPEPLPDLKIKRGDYSNVSVYTGPLGELVMDITNKDLILQDNSTVGGITLAKKKDLNTLSDKVEEVFQSVSNGKNLLETTIADKGVTVSKENEVPTFEELSNGINEISGEDLVGKQKLLDVIIGKVPSLDGVLTLDSPLSKYAHYMMMIGPMNILIKDNVNMDIVIKEKEIKDIILQNFNIDINTSVKIDSQNKIQIDFKTFSFDIISKIEVPTIFPVKDSIKGVLK